MKITVTIPLTVSADMAVTEDTNLDFLKQDIQHVLKLYLLKLLVVSNADDEVINAITEFTHWDIGAFEIGIG